MSTTDVVRIAQQGSAPEEDQGRLKADLQYLRRRGLFKASGEASYQGRKCARCGAPFGRFYNTGASCTRCRHRVCRQCRIEVRGPDNKDVEWICNVCYKIAELHVVTGKWMYENPVPGEFIGEKRSRSPVDVLKRSIRRAWTINGPPTRWNATRKSPELQIYRSLPTRHQEYREIGVPDTFKITKKDTSKSVEGVELEEESKDEPRRDTVQRTENPDKLTQRPDINERTKRGEKSLAKQDEEVPSDPGKPKKLDRSVASARTKTESQDESGNQEQNTPRVSLIKPPRILSKLISPEIKTTPTKHAERKSNIPIFKRSSKEFEDIRSPQESPKRSLIPQRYRGSTDDLRRSREDISVPSLIPKLLAPRGKEDHRLKRQDSKDDVRPRSCRRDSRDEPIARPSPTSAAKDDAGSKPAARAFRRESSREDVGRESTNSCPAAKGKPAGKEERQERPEARVGEPTTASKSKSAAREQAGTNRRPSRDACRAASPENEENEERERVEDDDPGVAPCDERASHASEERRGGSRSSVDEGRVGECGERKEDKEDKEDKGEKGDEKDAEHEEDEEGENDKGGMEETYSAEDRYRSMNRKDSEAPIKDAADSSPDNNEPDVADSVGERRGQSDGGQAKRLDDFQVIRRKFSKEEFSNPDDTDDTPNKRCSSHLSPEVSPLSTRSSRYSPRESESEPTPALPRKTGDSCPASQRIRDAITRTRRESNSSARYESSGSESVRLSETGLHGYVELARKVKFFGGTGSGTVSSIVGCDEVVQRDSATSAGEDEPRDDNYGRTGTVSSQGRTMLRRRRQFDAQGSRRRGRSHARACCGEELQSLQTLHVIGRGDRQPSPTGNQGGQEAPIVDYRRLVFISSDSSSGREEDDADSSCSSSSYLNGLPRGSGHAQALEDCDWDYFESGTLPLPSGATAAIGASGVATDAGVAQDWSCCPGRGSSACQACGGSRGANVLPVPVPIPVPVPYPVPVPAALWTGDFAAAASSMISRGDSHTEAGSLRLRGDPAAPWFAWHPRFNQPLHGARLDPRLTGVFDPTTCTFRPDQIVTPRLYGSVAEPIVPTTEPVQRPLNGARANGRDESDEVGTFKVEDVRSMRGESEVVGKIEERDAVKADGVKEAEVKGGERNGVEDREIDRKKDREEDREEDHEEDQEKDREDQLSSSFDREDRMYQHLREDSGSSSGRSSADSSDLEEDSSSHRFSRVFVVNDDSLTSDNDIEDNEEEDSDFATDGGVTLKRVSALPEEEPVVLQHVRLLGEDSAFDRREDRSENGNEPGDATLRSLTTGSLVKNDPGQTRPVNGRDSDRGDRRKARRRSVAEPETGGERVLLLEHRPIPEEIYLADDNDGAGNRVELKSIKTLDPDSLEVAAFNTVECLARLDSRDKETTVSGSVENLVTNADESVNRVTRNTDSNSEPSYHFSTGTWDSNIIPDSLEISREKTSNGPENVSSNDFETRDARFAMRVSTPISGEHVPAIDDENIARSSVTRRETGSDKVPALSGTVADETSNGNDDPADSNAPSSISNAAASSTDGSTNNESSTTTTGSEVSSDELHEYEVTPSPLLPYRDDHCPPADDETLHGTLHGALHGASRKFANETRATCTDDDENAEARDDFEHYREPVNDDSSKSDAEVEGCQSTVASDTGMSNSRGDSAPTDKASGVSSGRDVRERVIGDATSARKGTASPEMASVAEHAAEESGASAHDGATRTARGESPVGGGQVGGSASGSGGGGGGGGERVGGGEERGARAGDRPEGGSTRFRSVERRPSAGKENGFLPAATKDFGRDARHFPSNCGVNASGSTNGGNGNNSNNSNNRYRSLVMITQEASYQPVSVITSDTTTLLQPDEVRSGQGLAGYFQLALEAVSEQPHRKNGQGPRRPLMVKRLAAPGAGQQEPEADSGLSVGSASESDDVSVKIATRASGKQDGPEESAQKDRLSGDHRARASSQSSDDNSGSGGAVILEEGLADDDSWVEEVSHDEDEQGATTATEESSEDEANNLGDREEELRGYHRQAIDFTLHTIVEESCEESEAEPSLATGSPSKKQRPPSASELEKYFFFGLGGDGNSSSMGSREVDSLSETSSIYSEGLESLGQDEASPTCQSQDRSNTGEGFLNSSRLEKYFLSEFLGFDQDRRDSDGSVGSDSEGRPSPEAQRRKRLVRARGTGRSHSSSLDNLLALTQSSQNLSSQNSLQDLSLNQDAQETQSEGSSTETDGADDGQTAVFGTDGQFDTVKRKKKKPRNLGTQSPRVPDDRNKTPEPAREMVLVGEVVVEGDAEAVNSEDSERAKTPQPEVVLSSSSSPSITNNASATSPQNEAARTVQLNSGDSSVYSQRPKQQSRDSGFVGSCDDLLQHQKLPDDGQVNSGASQEPGKDRPRNESGGDAQTASQGYSEEVIGSDKGSATKVDHPLGHATLPHLANASLSRKDSFNNWSSDEETNLMMSKMRQFFKTMVATSNGQGQNTANSSGASPAPSPRLPGYSSKARLCAQNRTKPPQLVYFENELTRLMKTVPGIRDEQVREIVEYLSSEDTWSDSYDSSDYTSSDLEGAAGGRRSALQEQISQSCQQIISKFDTTSGDGLLADKDREDKTGSGAVQPPCLGRDTAFVYQKLVQSFTKMAGDGVSSDANSTPHSSPPLIAKVMHHIGSRLVALMHEVSEGGPAVQHHSNTWRRYSQHHRTPSSASTTEDDDSTSDSTNAPSSAHLQLPRSKSHDPLLLINNHPAASTGQEGEEREASDYERFSWRGSFESALMAADSRTKLSLLACSGDVSVGASASASALAMAAKRRSAGDLLFNPKSFSREQLDRVRSCGSIGGGSGGGAGGCSGSIEERIWSNRRRSSVPDANTRGESGASAGDEDTEDELEYGGESRATTLPRGVQAAMTAATNSLPRLPASGGPAGATTASTTPATMHKAHSVYHFLPQHNGVKSARYRPPGFARNSNVTGAIGGPKRAVSAPGLQVSGAQSSAGKRESSRSRRQQTMSLTPDDGSSLSEACSTPIIGAGSRASSSHAVMDMDDMESGLHTGHLATHASLSSLGARSDSMASVYSGAGEGRCCRSVVVTGEVEFALQYDYKHLTFEVHVTKCKNLAPVDVKRKRSDPYVKVYLLPDKSKSGKRKTKVKKHTLNPEFNETLKFHMSLSGLETRTLWLTVWHSDMFGRNDFLGEVRMPLENKIFDDPTPRWYPLQERTEPFDDPIAYKGEVIVGLKFVPPDPAQQQERERETGSDHRGGSKARKNWSRGALHVLVKEARNLQTRAKNSGTCDPFCKSYLLPDKGRSGKQKTGVVRRSGGSPVWGHTFIYKDVSLQELAERGLELTVWDHDRIASNEFLGGVRFNLGTGKHYGKPVDWMDATGRELSLWQSMLERPNFWVEGAVTLRPNLHNHGKNNGP